MWNRLFLNDQGYIRPLWFFLMMFFYPPYWGTGIRVTKTAPDYRYVRVEMPLTWYNHNYVGSHFGGSIYSMCDPFYMFMLIQILGPKYIVWDKGADIDFIKPGRGRLFTEFRWTQEEIDHIIQQTKSGEKYVFDKEVQIHDFEGLLIARVMKTLYVRLKV
jgi:hypothetical protein